MSAHDIDERHPWVHDLAPARLREWQQACARDAGLDVYGRDELGAFGQGPELAVIPPGVFAMGTPAADLGFGDTPQRHVHIDRTYAIGRHAVTAREFGVFARATGYRFAEHLVQSEGDEPVINVDRAAAMAYSDWLSAHSGQRYRLPSEAEWEYAARAGSATRYCFGDELGCAEANTGSFALSGRGAIGWRRFLPFCAPMNRVVPAGLYPANVWGLYDVHGNVWEFTADAWVGPVDARHTAGTGRDAKWFVTKGGSWFEPAWDARCAARKPRMRDELDVNLGFRVLREVI